jgi:ATP sulfurylase
MAGADPVMDASHFALVRATQAIMPRFPAATSDFALNPMVPVAAGPRESWLKAIVARNYGCSHLIIGGETPHGRAISAAARTSPACMPACRRPRAPNWAST